MDHWEDQGFQARSMLGFMEEAPSPAPDPPTTGLAGEEAEAMHAVKPMPCLPPFWEWFILFMVIWGDGL